ncbi:hypothetical protein CVD28_02795 [Bacillus sp. M6-12]|uniref:hypothetical protein n=1 Tax=Bacillus sp. M6-12 TaxID=2054166 RepID=UPI000C789C12|nr:hypothetical protein [Bacillus sp. M6-12]PLS19360.1 hypothetical protein CVD28_02795 [Bacillus sp. M6-12]
MERFIQGLLEIMNIKDAEEVTIEQQRKVISLLNQYLYTNYEGIGDTQALGKSFEYISDFHKFWEQRHQDILNPTINRNKCKELADVFHELYKESKAHFYSIYETYGLSNEAICQVRYFTASQDFKMDLEIEKILKVYKKKPHLFDKEFIYEKPETFLKETGITLEQRDKRIKFLKASAKLLIDYQIEAIDLAFMCDNDVLKVKEFLINSEGLGIKDKKADMFIRDMVVLNIWKDVKNFEKIGVASDSNTMKVALRTGILKTDIPLVSSFFDIFDHQHDLIYQMNEKAWRTVWEVWKEKYPDECIESPCLLDYLVYRIIGKEFCIENMYLFTCEDCEEEFVAKSKAVKKCPHCKGNTIQFQKKYIPCMHPKGNEIIKKNKFLSNHHLYQNCAECPFATVCKSKSEDFVKLNPPKTISILSASGWDRARVKGEEGGGGISA